ncbi:MAG: M15 family metallopeptidase [Chitinispirillaceae bacterium]
MFKVIMAMLFMTVQVFASTVEFKVKGEWRSAESLGLVNLKDIDSTIAVDLKYSTEDNFLNEDVYGEMDECYLQREAAVKLSRAQTLLDSIRPGHTLVVYDALRPRSVQYKMWDIVKDTPKRIYVAKPQNGSIHNYGAAVDVSILDENGEELDMGTRFDFFGELAQPRYEEKFLAEGKLTQEHVNNRKLLRLAMSRAGFLSISVEWWHFDAFDKKLIREKYPIVDDFRIR